MNQAKAIRTKLVEGRGDWALTERCAERIREYWAKKGRRVEVRVVPVAGDDGNIWGIRSDIRSRVTERGRVQ